MSESTQPASPDEHSGKRLVAASFIAPLRRHWLLFFGVVSLIAAACVMLVSGLADGAEMAPAASPIDTLLIGFVIGALLGPMSAATYWAAIGPGPPLVRFPAAAVWIALLVGTWGFAAGDQMFGIVVWFGVPFFGHFWLSQFCAWGALKTFRLRLSHRDRTCDDQTAPSQFSIGQLMAVTLMVAVVLGLGRLLWANDEFRAAMDETMYVVVAVDTGLLAMTLPLAIAALLPRWAGLGTVLGLLLIAAATFGEYPLLKLIEDEAAGLALLDLLSINLFASAWVLAFAGLLRLAGYRMLRTPMRAPIAQSRQPEASMSADRDGP